MRRLSIIAALAAVLMLASPAAAAGPLVIAKTNPRPGTSWRYNYPTAVYPSRSPLTVKVVLSKCGTASPQAFVGIYTKAGIERFNVQKKLTGTYSWKVTTGTKHAFSIQTPCSFRVTITGLR